MSATASSTTRRLHILHFNDVYNIEAPQHEAPGGAARFAAALKQQAKAIEAESGHPPLVLFSGDAFSPSLLSVSTLGKHMVPVLNGLGIVAACVGNHDLDFGLENFERLASQCTFPWLMANVLDANTGQPLGGVGRSLLLQHAGVAVGVMGLVEGEWVSTLSTIEPEEVSCLDFIAEGRRLARELRAGGAELVIALTHMRQPNDVRLAQEVEGIDIVLGGHDHFYSVEVLHPHGNILAKSGTDFRDLTRLDITLPPPPPAGAGAAAAAAAAAPSASGPHTAAITHEQQPAAAAAASTAAATHTHAESAGATASSSSSSSRLHFTWRHIQITPDIEEDADTAKVVAEYTSQLGARLGQVLGTSLTPLDGRFSTVRMQESNLANLLCDVFRRACSADVCIMNSGTFRSDAVHPPGPLTYRDLVTILPMMDETVVLSVTGKQLLAALENGVSQYPKQEGRFPQVSGIRFAFDPSQPPGSRVVPGSVTVGSEAAPLQLDQKLTLATKEYLAEGKDGFECLEGCDMLVDGETCPTLQTAVRNFFLMLDVVNSLLGRSAKVRSFAKRWAQAAKHRETPRQELLLATGNCVRDPDTGLFSVAPPVDGRIRIVGA